MDFNPGWGTRDDVDRALATAGVDRKVAVEVNDVHSLLDFVGFGLGVALVPASFAAKQTRARFVELVDAPTAETAVVTAPTVSAAASVLLDMVLEAGRGLPVAG
jgi:DNA-binding transcriptional LysR family regulator